MKPLGVAILALLSLAACRHEQPDSSPPVQRRASLEFVDAPTTLQVRCVSGCEGLVVNQAHLGGPVVIEPVEERETIELELTAPGYRKRVIQLDIEPGVALVPADLQPRQEASD